MASTTFNGPVTSLNGFIGGPNTNAHTGDNDTQQGGTTPFSATNTSTLTNGTDTLLASSNKGVLIYVNLGANATTSTYAFSNGTDWLQVNDPVVKVNIA
jgi:hypothetical protein